MYFIVGMIIALFICRMHALNVLMVVLFERSRIMPYATCRFPLVSEFKRLGDKNKFVAFIDSLLSGFGQIAFSDNPWSGLILIIGCFVGSFEQAVAGLCAAITATAFAYIIGTDKLVIRMGLFTFNAALAGLGIPLFIFPGQSVSVAMIILAVIAGIMCVLITAALNKIFSTRNVPSLALPYCITLFVLIPASLKLGTMHTTTSVVPFLDAPLGAENAQMTACSAGDFFTAVLNNMAEIIWQANIWSGMLYLLAVVISSRVDAISAVIASVVATAVAVMMGLSLDNIMIGLYGYNAILLMQAIFGRGYKMSVISFVMSVILAIISVFVTLWMQTLFAALGAAVTAFPYAIMAIGTFLARDVMKKMHYIDPVKWGVPETIAKELKKEEQGK